MARSYRLIVAAAAALALVACSAASDTASDEAAASNGGPAAIHPGWFKTPESIRATMTDTWELQISPAEEIEFFGGLRAALGGVNVAQQGSPVERPHELFALATHSLSVFAAGKLVSKQLAKTTSGEPYLFDGLGFSLEDDGCYADDARDWCDGQDGIVIGGLTSAKVDPNALTKEQRKRLMHKVQLVGEFFLMAIDDQTAMPGTTTHAPAFLVDEVLLPKLREVPLSAEQERLAWQEVVTTILMGGYFFDLPAEP